MGWILRLSLSLTRPGIGMDGKSHLNGQTRPPTVYPFTPPALTPFSFHSSHTSPGQQFSNHWSCLSCLPNHWACVPWLLRGSAIPCLVLSMMCSLFLNLLYYLGPALLAVACVPYLLAGAILWFPVGTPLCFPVGMIVLLIRFIQCDPMTKGEACWVLFPLFHRRTYLPRYQRDRHLRWDDVVKTVTIALLVIPCTIVVLVIEVIWLPFAIVAILACLVYAALVSWRSEWRRRAWDTLKRAIAMSVWPIAIALVVTDDGDDDD